MVNSNESAVSSAPEKVALAPRAGVSNAVARLSEPAPPQEARGPSPAQKWGLGFLVVCLAFLLASFPARNSDLWTHLARGRLLAHGQLVLSADTALSTGV